MMIDPVTLRQLSDIKMKERLEQAQKTRMLKEIAVSDSSLIEFMVTTVSGWMQRTKPMPTNYRAEPKRATAEIPSL